MLYFVVGYGRDTQPLAPALVKIGLAPVPEQLARFPPIVYYIVGYTSAFIVKPFFLRDVILFKGLLVF